MTWICKCKLTNVNASIRCADRKCNCERSEQLEPFDDYDEDLSKVRYDKIDRAINLWLSKDWRDKPMTPQEELFKELFNHEKVLVKDMELLELRAHREELTKIAFEARARLTAVDDEEKGRRNKAAEGKPTGFSKSVNTDEASTDAINKIKERQKKLSKADKIRDGLLKLGIGSLDADKIMSARNILSQTQKAQNTTKPEEPKTSETTTPMFNPFSKGK